MMQSVLLRVFAGRAVCETPYVLLGASGAYSCRHAVRIRIGVRSCRYAVRIRGKSTESKFAAFLISLEFVPDGAEILESGGAKPVGFAGVFPLKVAGSIR